MRYSCDTNFIYLINPPYTRKDEIKYELSGVWFDTDKRGKGWRFPKTLHAYRELWHRFPELRKDKDFISDGKLAAGEIEYWMAIKERRVDKYEDGRPELRPYQNQDMYYLSQRGSALVLNEPRTGKTPTMISVIKALGTTKNLIVCPSSLVLNWAKEFSIWYPECEVYAIAGDKKKRVSQLNHYALIGKNKLSVLIISKDTLKIEIKGQLEDFKCDTMVVDEAHFLRNYKTAQSKAVFEVYAKYKYALTGTPSVKHGSDVYGLLHFMNPAQFPSYWQFTDRYWDIIDNGWGKDLGREKEHRRDELQTLMAINSVQRKRKEVMQWLPEATHQTIPVQMDKAQVNLYEQMFEDFMATEGEGEEEHGVDTMNKLSQLLRLRQLCLDPRLLGFKPVGAKTKMLLEFAEDNTDPFVVMTTFSSYFKLVKEDLEKLGKSVEVIDGSVTKVKRQKIVEKFQAGKIDILLCNIIAAGVGLTLDKADTIIFLDKAFNPADNEQAQDRIVPTTKERYHPVTIISVVCGGTVDERVNEILDRKEDLTKLINKPGVFI